MLGYGGAAPVSPPRPRETSSDPIIYRPANYQSRPSSSTATAQSLSSCCDLEDESCEEGEEEDDGDVEMGEGFAYPDGAYGLSGTTDQTMCLLVGLLRGVLFWRIASGDRIVASDRFGNETARSDGLGISDDQVSLKVS